jgi:hypothetical protein
MKLLLVASMTAVLAFGIAGKAEAHDYRPAVGGSLYLADGNFLLGLNLGWPYVQPYYVPPRYVYRPRSYSSRYDKGYRYSSYRSHGRDHHHGYRKGYGRDDHRGRGRGRGRSH